MGMSMDTHRSYHPRAQLRGSRQKMPISQPFPKRNLLAYLKSYCLRVKLLIQHTCKGGLQCGHFLAISLLPAPNDQYLPGKSLYKCLHLSFYGCCSKGRSQLCQPMGLSFRSPTGLQERRKSSCWLRSTPSPLLAIHLGPLQRKQAKTVTSQFLPGSSLIIYFPKHCLRVWLPTSLHLGTDYNFSLWDSDGS